MDLDRLVEILDCPACRVRVEPIRNALFCPECGHRYRIEDGVPWMIVHGTPSAAKEEDLAVEKPYVRIPRDLTEEFRDGIVLDFGAGNQKQKYPHVVQFDTVRYPTTDVLGTPDALPFQDSTFDAVYSSSAIEYLPDPFLATAEIHRVTKPGGVILLRAAFMQPFRSEREHYFNMTVEGLRRLMRDFHPLEVSWDPTAPDLFRWVLAILLQGMDPPARKEALGMTFGELVARMERNDYGPFEKISDDARKALSPCVYFCGYK